MKTTRHFLSYLAQLILESEMFRANVVEKIKPHSLFNNFFSENRAVYEIMWKNIIERGRLQMTVWRLRIACWVTKATNTHLLYVILIAFPLQQQSHKRASVLNHTCLACLVNPIHNSTLCSS